MARITDFEIESKQDTDELIGVKLQRIRQVLPDSLLTEISALSAFTNQIRWRTGDAVNRVHKSIESAGQGDFMDACWFVALTTDEFRSQNTLKAYAYTAQFYPRKVRRLYRADEIPFSHFTYAKTLKGDLQTQDAKGADILIPMWEVCLQYSVAWYEQHGWCTTEKKLRALFSSFEQATNPDGSLADGLFKTPVVVAPDPAPVALALRSPSYSDVRHVIANIATRMQEVELMLPALGRLWPKDKSARVADLIGKLKHELQDETPGVVVNLPGISGQAS